MKTNLRSLERRKKTQPEDLLARYFHEGIKRPKSSTTETFSGILYTSQVNTNMLKRQIPHKVRQQWNGTASR